MLKFNDVKKMVEEKTKNSANCLTLTKKVEARHNGKYALKNVYTNNLSPFSFNTLSEVVEYLNNL